MQHFDLIYCFQFVFNIQLKCKYLIFTLTYF